MHKLSSGSRSKQGFSLAELMLVVAIMAILAGLTIPGIVSYQRMLNMKELDNCAQELFLAAQNRLTAQKSSGTVAQLSNTNGSDDRRVRDIAALSGYQAYYLTQNTVNELLPQGTLESQLQGNYFYVIYDEDSASVLTVLFGKSPFSYQNGYQAVGLDVNARIQSDLWIGWYSGAPSGSESIIQLPAPSITIRNGEKLVAEITVTTPSASAAPLSSIDLKASIGSVNLNVGTPVPVGALSQKYTVILDSLAPGEPRFQSLGTDVAPGDDFTIKAWAVGASLAVHDSPTNYATDNSLFASGSGEGTAYLSCARHLQNLDQSSGVLPSYHQAVQTANLRFDDIGTDTSWYAYYTQQGRSFVPITNPNLASYNGYDSSKLTQSTITGLTVLSSKQAGLFASFAGQQLSNIWMVNTQLKATQSAGALAAQATASQLTIDNCRVYHAYSDRSVKDALARPDNHQLTSPTVGGLIGKAQGALTIQNSLSATLIQGTTVGGLVGSALSANITASYSDCYLSGFRVGGLAGNVTQSSTVTSSYCAGFAADSDTVAGLVCGSAAVSDSYSALSYLSAKTIYPLITSGSATQAYYLNTPSKANTIGTACSSNQLKQLKLSPQFAPASGSSTRPYNLSEGMALTVYAFPRLSNLTHYGDWKSEFESGALVYYEVYDDGSYGFYGGSLGRLQESATVRQDGYAVAFRRDDPANTVSVTYQGKQQSLPFDLSKLPVVTDTALQDGKPVTTTYCLLSLPDEIVNSTVASTDFYQTISLQVDGASTSYFFNPHFAKTAVAELDDETDLPSVPSPISVRTPRHLYALSHFSTAYANHADWAFSQELPLPYGLYQWSKAGFTATIAANKAASSALVQAPIGPQTPFSATYNGNSRPISGISITGDGYYMGLFGLNTGTIQSVIYDSDGCFVRRTGGISGRSATLYIGGLAGQNEGIIRESAVAYLDLTANNTGNSTVFMGGLVGDNLGLIRQCSAACDTLQVTSTRANTYASAFVSENSGTITRSYAQGAVKVAKDTSGTVVAAGFVCQNTGSITSSYCAAGLYADGGAQEASFCWESSSKLSSCSYLTDGSYTFGGQTFGLTYRDDSGATGLTQLQLAQRSITGMSLAPDSTRLDHDNNGTVDEIDDSTIYPYPMIFNQHYGNWIRRLDLGAIGVCYWEKETKTAPDGSTSDSYHFSFVGLQNPGAPSQAVVSDSTLCGYHDDGGVITDYGYGYYYRSSLKTAGSSTDPVTIGFNNLSNSSASNLVINDAAQKALQTQMEDKYVFTTYNTYAFDTAVQLANRGLYPSSSNVNGTFTLTYDREGYDFTVSPFFADAMRFNGDSKTFVPGSDSNNPYGVRSIRQLQFINWNKGYANCITDSQNRGGNYPYLGSASGKHYWVQTHDIKSAQSGDTPTEYTPIGSMSAEFRSSYNGGDYKIENLAFSSASRFVGLFGVALGANLDNIVMCSSDGKSFITSTTSYDSYTGTGGIVGAALNPNKGATISNCSISGYTITNNNKTLGWDLNNNPATYGSAVGGLAGWCNMNFSNCTAVADVVAGDQFNYTADTQKRVVRIGGLVGSAACTISSCYVGGSVTDNSNSYVGKVTMGGIVGSGDVPATLLGGPGSALSVQNSYSYCTVKQNSGIFNSNNTTRTVYTVGPVNSTSNCYYLDSAITAGTCTKTGTARTYEQFTDGTLLTQLNSKISDSNKKFAIVTTKYADGTPIDGKYTLPSSSDLSGRNYPFPTILTQSADAVEGKLANLHYGNWPEKGILGTSLVEVDLIATRPDGNPDHIAQTALVPTGVAAGGTYEIVTSDSYDPQIAQVAVSSKADSQGRNTLTVTGLNQGFTNVTVAYTVNGQTYNLDIEIAVTATVNVTVAPANSTLLSGGFQEFTATAADKYGNNLAGKQLSWDSVVSNTPSVADVSSSMTTADAGFTFTAQGLSRDIETQDAIFTVTAHYVSPGSKDTYLGQGRSSVTVVPVTITAQPIVLTAGGNAVTYGINNISVLVQGQVLSGVSITAARTSDQTIAQCKFDPKTGLVTVTGLKAGQTQATLTLSFSYSGKTYQNTVTIPVSVVAPTVSISPTTVYLSQNSTGHRDNAATAYVLNSSDSYTYGLALTSCPAGLTMGVDTGSTAIDATTGAITVDVPTASLGNFVYTVTATRTNESGATSTLTATFTVSVVDTPVFTLGAPANQVGLYGGQGIPLALTLTDGDGNAMSDWSGFTFTCTSDSSQVTAQVDVPTKTLQLTAARVSTAIQVNVTVTAKLDEVTSSFLVPVSIYPPPVLTLEQSTLEVLAPQDSLHPDTYPLSISLNAWNEEKFTLTVDSGFDIKVIRPQLVDSTLELSILNPGETTVTVTAVHKDDPTLRTSASLRIKALPPPDIQISSDSLECFVPKRELVTIPLALESTLPSNISNLEIVGVTANDSNSFDISYSQSQLKLNGKSIGWETKQLTIQYRYTLSVGETSYVRQGSDTVTLDVTVFTPTTNTSFSSRIASASILQPMGSDLTLTITNGPNNGVWSNPKPEYLDPSSDKSTLEVVVRPNIPAGFYDFISGRYTFSLDVYANPTQWKLTFSPRS